jgi:hypothetical protein
MNNNKITSKIKNKYFINIILVFILKLNFMYIKYNTSPSPVDITSPFLDTTDGAFNLMLFSILIMLWLSIFLFYNGFTSICLAYKTKVLHSFYMYVIFIVCSIGILLI